MSTRTWSSPLRAAVAVTVALLVALPWLAAPPAARGIESPTPTTTTIEFPDGTTGSTLSVAVHVRPSPYDPGAIGTCVFVELDLKSGLCLPIDAAGDATRVFLGVTKGMHSVHAAFAGGTTFGASESTVSVTVTDGSVTAKGISLPWRTFYPVKDGYRDTLAIRNVVVERVQVVVRIRNAAGRLVRTKDLGWRNPGTVSWAWAGRNDLGNLVAAGTYTISERITDASGNTIVQRAEVRLSHKTLHWYTQTITRHGDAYGYSWDSGDGWISQARSSYADGVRLRAGEDYVGVRYGFRLQEAVVYGTLKFRVLGRSPVGLKSQAALWIGALADPVAPAWSPKSYEGGLIGPSYRWWTVAESGAHRNGTLTFGMVRVWNELIPGAPLNTFDIAKVQLVYRYAVLR